MKQSYNVLPLTINNSPILSIHQILPIQILTQVDSVLGEGPEPFFEGRARDGTASRGSPFSQQEPITKFS
jgi:hypothetical protein